MLDEHFTIFHNEFDQLNNIRALMLYSIYQMSLKLLKNAFLE